VYQYIKKLFQDYTGTPCSPVVSSDELLISSARSFKSSTSQFAHTNFPLRNSASGDASQTRK
jgi:hypothetical protein